MEILGLKKIYIGTSPSRELEYRMECGDFVPTKLDPAEIARLERRARQILKEAKMCKDFVVFEGNKIKRSKGKFRKGEWAICLDCKRIYKQNPKAETSKEFAYIKIKKR